MSVSATGDKFSHFQGFHDAEVSKISVSEDGGSIFIDLSNLYYILECGDEEYDPSQIVHFLFRGVTGIIGADHRHLIASGVLELSINDEIVTLCTDKGSLSFRPRTIVFGYGPSECS